MHFHAYVYGHGFIVQYDDKPLEQIQYKKLVDAVICLQCMLLHFKEYDVTMRYYPVMKMLLLHYDPQPRNAMALNIAIHHTRLSPEHIPGTHTDH